MLHTTSNYMGILLSLRKNFDHHSSPCILGPCLSDRAPSVISSSDFLENIEPLALTSWSVKGCSLLTFHSSSGTQPLSCYNAIYSSWPCSKLLKECASIVVFL